MKNDIMFQPSRKHHVYPVRIHKYTEGHLEFVGEISEEEQIKGSWDIWDTYSTPNNGTLFAPSATEETQDELWA